MDGVEGDTFAFLGVVGGGVEGSSLGERDSLDSLAARLAILNRL